MKKIFMTLVMFSSIAQSAIFCEIEGRRVSLFSSYSQVCKDNLLMGSGVCFNGDRKKSIQLLNSQEVRNLFNGTDGEYILNAHFLGKDSISYLMVDEANDYIQKHRMDRCK